MHLPSLKCPSCGSTLPNRQLHVGKPVICPACSTPLRVARWYLNLASIGALGLTAAACFTFGPRYVALAIATVVLWFPAYLLSLLILSQIYPPKFERYLPSSDSS
jgi:hypothetical protein